MAATPFRITINPTPASASAAKEYPCLSWQKVDQGRPLSIAWNKGFRKGMGQAVYQGDNERCLSANWLDVSAPPYIRLFPGASAVISGLTGLDLSFPLHWIPAKQPDGTNVLYLFNGTRRFKINRDANTLTANVTIASVVYGRPAFFEGSWRIPRGESVACATLTISNGADTGGTDANGFTPLAATFASNFATVQDGTTAKIAKSSLNIISLSSDFASFVGAFEAGDSSLNVTDLLEWQGELLVIKADGPRRFSVAGDSIPLQRFVGANLSSGTYEGSNSHVHGPYAYWVAQSGIWRLFGEFIFPVGFESDPDYFSDSTDFIDDAVNWKSVVAYGRWIYATRGKQLWQGYIEDDGKVTWLSALVMDGLTTMRLAIDDTPALWLIGIGTAAAIKITLQADGSTRSALDVARAAAAAGTAVFVLPKADFDFADRLKQLRRLWVITEAMANSTLSLRVQRDGAAVATVGATITTSGFFERIPTPGTDDTAREFRAQLSWAWTGTSDSRIRAFGMDCHTLDLYRAQIPLTKKAVRGFSGGIRGLLKQLRDLQQAQLVNVKEPELNTTFSGYVMSVSEQTVDEEGGEGIGYMVDVLIERAAIPA